MTDTVTIIGNLAAEPDQKVLPSGVIVTNFRVGSTHRRYDKPTEQWVDQYTNWYQVSAYRALGENAFSSLHKGDRVIVSGRLKLREWDNGTKKGVAAEVDAEAVGHDLLWGRTAFQRSGAPRAASAPAPSTEEAPSTPTSAPAESRVAVTDADGWGIPAASAAGTELVDIPF